jgi:choline dehydrogenase-like flavoprotein
MQHIHLSEIKNLVEYEKVRDTMRARVIELKKNRRVGVGDNLTFLFENRDTVLFQIQEMVRTERIVDPARIQEEIDAYNALVPGPGELSATLFIEIPELSRMSNDEVRRTINRFQGLDRDVVRLRLGDRAAVPARFEEGHSKEEKMAAVHYLRFSIPRDAEEVLADPRQAVRLAVDHPNYRAEAEVPAATRAELLADLRS